MTTINRLLLYLLTALAAVGAVYFFAIQMIAMAIPLLLLMLLVAFALIKLRRRG